jgi:fluoroacetyl-CoA thioesterase
MSKPVPVGARGEASEIVEHQHTLTAHHKELPPVYSTPDMIRLMETACFHALQPYAEADEITVGTKIDVVHRAATTIGSKVTAEAVVESFDGRFYSMRVRAWDDKQEIGSGTVGRAFVSIGRFMSKLQQAGGMGK